MEKIIITKQNENENENENDIIIPLIEPCNPIEAAQNLINELKEWTGENYSKIKTIQIQ